MEKKAMVDPMISSPDAHQDNHMDWCLESPSIHGKILGIVDPIALLTRFVNMIFPLWLVRICYDPDICGFIPILIPLQYNF